MAQRKYKVKTTGEINTFTVIVEEGKSNNPREMENTHNELKSLLSHTPAPANPQADYNSIGALVKATDFDMLANQKAIIVKATSDEPLTAEEKAELEGMLSFLDAFQDFCVDTLGEDKKRIFPNLTDSEDE